MDVFIETNKVPYKIKYNVHRSLNQIRKVIKTLRDARENLRNYTSYIIIYNIIVILRLSNETRRVHTLLQGLCYYYGVSLHHIIDCVCIYIYINIS